jgi:hypothetical protein
LVVTALASAAVARADRYEATLVVRPTGSFGRVAEAVGDRPGSAGPRSTARQTVVDSVSGGGLDVGLSYGLRNWLDVGGELGAAGFTRATYDPASVTIGGEPATGHVERTTRAVQLRAGATLRLGVAWVPVVYLGLGVGTRRRTAATIPVQDHQGQPVDLTPDHLTAGFTLDLVTAVRVGLEHRIDRRWTVGVDASASHTMGLGAATLDTLSGSVSLGYTWYALWPR